MQHINKKSPSFCQVGHRFTFFGHSNEKDMMLSADGNVEDGENWCSQINRLQQLLDKLECQVCDAFFSLL